MAYRFKISSFLLGCVASLLLNAAVLATLVFIALHIQILARFIDIAGAITGGYKLSQASESIPIWTMIRIGAVLIAQAAAIGVIGNILGWYSYCYLTARGKIQAGYASFIAPILIGFFIGGSVALLACFMFSFVVAALTLSFAEDCLLRDARQYLKRQFPSVKFSREPQSLRELLLIAIPQNSQSFDHMLLKTQEYLFKSHDLWVDADFTLPAPTILPLIEQQAA